MAKFTEMRLSEIVVNKILFRKNGVNPFQDRKNGGAYTWTSLGSVAGSVIQATGRTEFEDGLRIGDQCSLRLESTFRGSALYLRSMLPLFPIFHRMAARCRRSDKG